MRGPTQLTSGRRWRFRRRRRRPSVRRRRSEAGCRRRRPESGGARERRPGPEGGPSAHPPLKTGRKKITQITWNQNVTLGGKKLLKLISCLALMSTMHAGVAR